MDFETVHRPGIVHKAADALSRLLTDGEDTSPLEDDVSVLAINRQTTTRNDLKILTDDKADLEDYRKQPDNDSQDEQISREAFLTAQHHDPECQQFAYTNNENKYNTK